MIVSNDKKTESIKTRKMSIERKIAINGILMGLLICGVLIGMARHIVSEYLIISTKTKTMALAEIAAAKIDGDLFDTLTQGDEKSEVYGAMQRDMFDIFNDKDITYVYTLKPLNDREVQFVVAAAPEGDPCQIGDPYDKQVEMEEAFKGKTSVTKEAVKDDWGIFYTAYAPVYNSNGQVVGIVGIDCESSNINAQINTLIRKLMGAGLICIILAVMLSIILARKIGKNILAVNQKLMNVIYSDGDLTKKLEVTSGDELEIVADNINALLENVRTNMVKLKTSSIDMKESFDSFREDMDSSVEQITQVSATMQEMYGSMEETSDSFNKAKEMAQVVTHSIDDIKEKTTYGFEFSEKIEYKSSELKEGADVAQKLTSEKLQEIDALLNEKIEEAKAVEQINELTQSIIEIAEQTGLLALNANIEAARAGEHGRGFSIVAREVAKLAEDSSNTANQIQNVSSTIITIVNELVTTATTIIEYVQNNVMEDYEKFVQSGNQYNEDAKSIRQLMNGFKKETENLQQAMYEVDHSMNQIAVIIEESMERTTDVAKIAEKMDYNMQQMGEETKDNQKQIETMNEVVSQYKVGI